MIKVLKQALDVLEYWDVHGGVHQPTEEAIEAGKQAIAELESQEQAKTVHITWNADGIRTVNGVPDYTPPQRTEPATCERCKQLEEQAYDLLGRLQAANLSMAMFRQADQFKEMK